MSVVSECYDPWLNQNILSKRQVKAHERLIAHLRMATK